MDNVQTLNIPGAKGSVQIDGALGIFYRIVVDGKVIKPVKGRWLIPATRGEDIELRQRGLLPGFQTLAANGEPVIKLGAHVPVWLRVLMFVPLLLILVNPVAGLVLGVAFFLGNVLIVKNPHMPLPLRAALPLINTAAAGVVIAVLSSAVG